MRIESIDIRGFGCLRDMSIHFPPDRAVLVIDENEAGKSTLASAIVAGLCGIPTRRAQGEAIKLLDVHKPWDGGPYGLRMVVNAAGRRYIIERDFSKSAFAVRSADTNRDISAEFEKDLAFHFLRLAREDFLRIAFISGKEVSRFSSSPDLRGRLAELVEGSTEDSGAETAIALLSGATYPLDGRSVKAETAIDRLTKAIDVKTLQMAELDSRLDSAGDDVSALDDSRLRCTELEARLCELDVEYNAARLREVRQRIAAAESDVAEIASLRDELARLQPFSTFPAERRDRLAGASARSSVASKTLEELSRKSNDLTEKAADLRSRLDMRKGFTLATDDDPVALRAAEDALRGAAESVDRARQELAAAKHSSARTIALSVLAIGLLTGLVSFAMMILQVVGVVPSAVGALVGVAVAVAGWIHVSRADSRSAEARIRSEQADVLLAEARARAVARLVTLGIEVASEVDVTDLLARTRELLASYLADRDSLRSVEQELGSVSRGIGETRERIEQERETIRSILTDAGIDPSLPVDEAMREFDSRERSYRRWREIKETLLPALESRALSPEALAVLRAEEMDLLAQQASAESPRTVRASSQVESDRQLARREFGDANARVRELEGRIGTVVDTYRREYPALQEEVRSLRAELEKARRFGRAVEIAAETLREVASDTRRRWAAALNEQAGDILPHLNPDYSDLRFDDQMGFTVRHVSGDRIIDRSQIDAYLSTGAKDQVYLAVRLACCAELSKLGEPLPIILDDPLIAFDDDRFARAFRYLVEHVARKQQIIILTCHRSRHESLTIEPWFRDGASTVDISRPTVQ
jgi:uncharacterized protein YhaN